MKNSRKSPRGFSLFEVVIAVGIFALAISVILALLPGLAAQAAGSAETMAALRLPDAVRLELQRAVTVGGLDALAGRTTPMASPLPATLTLAAARDATRVQTLNYLPPAVAGRIAEAEQYFLIEVWSFSPTPLAFDPAGAGLALYARVSWPYRTPNSNTPTPPAEREVIVFSLALER